MKAKIQGIEYEGSAEEMAELISALKNITPTPAPANLLIEDDLKNADLDNEKRQNYKIRHRKEKRIVWTKKDDSKLKKLNDEGLTLKRLSKEFKRSPNAIRVRLYHLKVRPNLHKRSKARNIKEHDESGRPLLGATLWIHRRAKNLVNEYKYDYEKARGMAKDEWMSKRAKFFKKKKTPTNKESVNIPASRAGEFPKFKVLSDDGNLIFESILKNTAKLNYPIKYNEVALPLGIESVGMWNDFVKEFIQKQSELTSWVNGLLGLKGRFHVSLQYKMISYEQ